MIKLFAILTVLAALPVSALAGQVNSNPLAAHCTKDSPDVYAQAPVPTTAVHGQTNDASIAR